MDTNKIGVLPSQELRKMITEGKILAARDIEKDQIQPSSLDLRLGTKAWRIRASFLPGHKSTVINQLDSLGMQSMDILNGCIFEKNCVYLVLLEEHLKLPNKLNAISNAKSSIGRLDLLTRLITDFGTEFDRITNGYEGPLYVEINPKSFSVLVRSGMKLNQIRFRNGKVLVDDLQLKRLNEEQKLTSEDAVIDDGISFSVDLKGDKNKIVGYKARANAPLIDLNKINYYEITDFWEPVYTKVEGLILDPGAFYILVSKETVHIPPNYAAEMSPYLAIVGEFRVHYAGFFDPGFGHAAVGGTGSRGVLEVRCHESPFTLKDGQIVGRLIYEFMSDVPDILYGSDLNSNYQGQTLKLSKHFKVS
jgi:dCTP deaminase